MECDFSSTENAERMLSTAAIMNIYQGNFENLS